MVEDDVVIDEIVITRRQAPKPLITKKRALKRVRTKKPSLEPTSDISMVLVLRPKTLEIRTLERRLTRSRPN